MSLRNRVRVIAVVVIALWTVFGLWLLPTRGLGTGWILSSACLAVLIGLTIVNLTIRPHLARLRGALADEDIPTAQREVTILSDFFKLRGRER